MPDTFDPNDELADALQDALTPQVPVTPTEDNNE